MMTAATKQLPAMLVSKPAVCVIHAFKRTARYLPLFLFSNSIAFRRLPVLFVLHDFNQNQAA